MGYDRYGRCAVCGHTKKEECCTHCHQAHDKLMDEPIWAVSFSQVGNQRIVPAKGNKYNRPNRATKMPRRHSA